ncbi:hypothetical protein CP02DC15_0014A, partial [Chlamydia psittaci 02DC15]
MCCDFSRSSNPPPPHR